MQSPKPIASLALDLDNKWSYMKTHGDPGWERFPSYLDVLVPRILNLLKDLKLRITFFIVGQDAALDRNRDLLRCISAAGHEIANHSFHHEPWMHLYSKEKVKTEIALAEEHIERATGQRPLGFRGPGYSFSKLVLQELVRRGYHYDASTFPNLLAPLIRACYLQTAQLTAEQRRQRLALGGTLRAALLPIRPYRWQMNEGQIIEIPVTTLPFFRIPIQVSYLMCLRVFSPTLALRYFNLALRLCRLTVVQPSLLLHPTDFLGCDDVQDLSFLPGMSLPSAKKMEFVAEILRRFSSSFTILTLQQYAFQVSQMSTLANVEPTSNG